MPQSSSALTGFGAGLAAADVPADTLLDNTGELDHTTARLQQREEQLLAEYERNAAMLAALGPGGTDVLGHGAGADGAVVAQVDATNRLVDLYLDPKALRLGSIEALRQAILTACQQAADDVSEQLNQAGREAAPPEAVRALLDSMPELTDLLPESTYRRYLEPDGPQPDSSSNRAPS